MNPAVSVIIPTHNRAEFIGEAVESALNQSGCRTDVIVVDDASTDETSDVLARYGQRIRVIKSEENIERAAARNLGARIAQHEILAFLDSDDVWLEDKLSHQIAPALRGMASVTGVSFVSPTGANSLREYVPPAKSAQVARFQNPYLAAPSSLVIPREQYFSVGGFPEEREVQGSEDWLFVNRLLSNGYSIEVIPEVLVRYRVHDSNFTSDPSSVASCMWAATRWLVQHDVVQGAEIGRLRGRTAGILARQFARRGQGQDALHWLYRAARHGNLAEFLRASVGTMLSALRYAIGLLERRS